MSSLIEQLSALEDRWLSLDASAAGTLAPGMPAEAVAADLTAAGLAAHPDLLTWWGWHNGQGDQRRNHRVMLAGRWGLFALSDALRAREANLRSHAEFRLDFPDAYRSTWIPIADGETCQVVVDCESGEVFRHNWEAESFPEGRRPSLSSLVRLWLTAFETGIWKPPTSPDNPFWEDPSVRDPFALSTTRDDFGFV